MGASHGSAYRIESLELPIASKLPVTDVLSWDTDDPNVGGGVQDRDVDDALEVAAVNFLSG